MPHIPVLLKETLEYLDPKPGENFIDCTLGGAGHAAAILEKIIPDGKLLGIDLDIDSLKAAEVKIQNSKFKNNLILVQDNFANLKSIVEEYNFKPVSGILFDLGMSSWHLDESGRGFSFKKDEPLDMRYESQVQSSKFKVQNQNSKLKTFLTAEQIVNTWSNEKLERIFREYGEERFARRIAGRICEKRKRERIKTTFQLIKIIGSAFPRKYKFGKMHFATRIFQALRIAVNNELEILKKVLPDAIEILEPNGKIVVISFHSLEDRIVKHFFKEQAKLGKLKIITKKPISPDEDEIQNNPRSRSGKLRIAEKI